MRGCVVGAVYGRIGSTMESSGGDKGVLRKRVLTQGVLRGC